MHDPVFIVGASRCGTELARSVLNRHSLFHIAKETHWFDDQRPRLVAPDRAPDDVEESALVDYLLSVSRHGYGLRQTGAAQADAAALRKRWRQIGPSADDAFAAHCIIQAEANGKTIWGEKTPRHLFRAAEILEAFPRAKLLVCLRDPRGAVASYRDWRNNWFDRASIGVEDRAAIEAEELRARRSYGLTLATMFWRSAARTALQLRERLPAERLLILRFESLLTKPETTCRLLADWLGVEFESAMLDATVTNSSYEITGKINQFDVRAASRWRERLTSDEVAYIEWLTRREMTILGYVPDEARLKLSYAGRQLVDVPRQVLRAFAANRNRIGNLAQFIAARAAGLR